MEKENNIVATSLQQYELGLQKVERKMRKMNMTSTKAMTNATKVEEHVADMQEEIKGIRDHIAKLEQRSQKQRTTQNTILQPVITRINTLESEIKRRPTKQELQGAVHYQVSQWAAALEAKFEEKMTRTTVQNDLNIGMTMYNALATNINNVTIQEWTTNVDRPQI
jgi:uncharacterized protein (DUF3084 family)